MISDIWVVKLFICHSKCWSDLLLWHSWSSLVLFSSSLNIQIIHRYVCVCIVTKHLFPMQFLGTLPLCTEDAFVLLILTYLTIIAGKDVTWCELRFLSFALNILIPFIKTQKKISWKLYYVNKLGMFQNDMMSYDSTLFHGTLTNWGHEKNWVKPT